MARMQGPDAGPVSRASQQDESAGRVSRTSQQDPEAASKHGAAIWRGRCCGAGRDGPASRGPAGD